MTETINRNRLESREPLQRIDHTYYPRKKGDPMIFKRNKFKLSPASPAPAPAKPLASFITRCDVLRDMLKIVHHAAVPMRYKVASEHFYNNGKSCAVALPRVAHFVAADRMLRVWSDDGIRAVSVSTELVDVNVEGTFATIITPIAGLLDAVKNHGDLDETLAIRVEPVVKPPKEERFEFEASDHIVKVFEPSSYVINTTLSLVEATDRIKNQKSLKPTHPPSSTLRNLVDRMCGACWTETVDQFASEGVDKRENFKVSVVIQLPK